MEEIEKIIEELRVAAMNHGKWVQSPSGGITELNRHRGIYNNKYNKLIDAINKYKGVVGGIDCGDVDA